MERAAMSRKENFQDIKCPLETDSSLRSDSMPTANLGFYPAWSDFPFMFMFQHHGQQHFSEVPVSSVSGSSWRLLIAGSSITWQLLMSPDFFQSHFSLAVSPSHNYIALILTTLPPPKDSITHSSLKLDIDLLSQNPLP